MGIGGHADAAIAALGAQLIALAAARPVFEGFHRLCHAAFVISAVINHGGPVVGPVWKISPLNEVPPAYLDLIDVEAARDRVDGPFGDVSSLGPAVAAIGVNRHGISYDHLGARLVVRD